MPWMRAPNTTNIFSSFPQNMNQGIYSAIPTVTPHKSSYDAHKWDSKHEQLLEDSKQELHSAIPTVTPHKSPQEKPQMTAVQLPMNLVKDPKESTSYTVSPKWPLTSHCKHTVITLTTLTFNCRSLHRWTSSVIIFGISAPQEVPQLNYGGISLSCVFEVNWGVGTLCRRKCRCCLSLDISCIISHVITLICTVISFNHALIHHHHHVKHTHLVTHHMIHGHRLGTLHFSLGVARAIDGRCSQLWSHCTRESLLSLVTLHKVSTTLPNKVPWVRPKISLAFNCSLHSWLTTLRNLLPIGLWTHNVVFFSSCCVYIVHLEEWQRCYKVRTQVEWTHKVYFSSLVLMCLEPLCIVMCIVQLEGVELQCVFEPINGEVVQQNVFGG